MADELKNERKIQRSYVFNGVTYLQRNAGGSFFVAPGFPRHTEEIHEGKLIEAGAKLTMRFGWERSFVQKKTDVDSGRFLEDTIQAGRAV